MTSATVQPVPSSSRCFGEGEAAAAPEWSLRADRVPADRVSALLGPEPRAGSEHRHPGRLQDEVVLTNARIVTARAVFRGTVHLARGRILAVDTGRSTLSSAVDMQGDLLIPGLIDMHTDNLERHLEPRPGVAYPSFAALIAHDRQAAAAGITTVFDALCIGDRKVGRARGREIVRESLQAISWAQADGLLKSFHFMHLRCEVTADAAFETFMSLADEPLVRLVSLMDHTPGQRQWRDVAQWRKFTRGDDVSDTELDAIYERRIHLDAHVGAVARRQVAAHCCSRGLTLASHDDTTADHVAEAAADGVTICEFPTTALSARLARSAGMQVVMGAPNIVLGGSHSGNVSASLLAAAGLVDALASDYVPVSLLQACFVLRDVLGLALPAAVAMVTAHPAMMLGLQDRGEIVPGARADLVWVKEHRTLPIVRGVWREGQRVA